MQHFTLGINSVIFSVSLIHILVFHLLATLHTVITTIFTINHSSYFTLDLKLTSSSSHFHHRLLHRYSLD